MTRADSVMGLAGLLSASSPPKTAAMPEDMMPRAASLSSGGGPDSVNDGKHVQGSPSPRYISLSHPPQDVHVTHETIEDLYVKFILDCNPAVPPTTDTKALRKAFWGVSTSGDKTFSTFVLFGLVKQYETGLIKSFNELVLKLGVSPPDTEKGESSQKVQQYATRLKRWMHALHLDAFFKYLCGIESEYWTKIPTDPNPVYSLGREGVIAENDNALCFLMPQLRQRRRSGKAGRARKAEDDLHDAPSQRPRLSHSPLPAEDAAARPNDQVPWTAHPDGVPRGGSLHPTDADPRSSVPRGSESAFPWTSSDIARAPMSAYPQSAVTPSSRGAFWNDHMEAQSAITPTKSQPRRHGAKVVSSAWRSGAASAGAKPRGRPPVERSSKSLTAASDDGRSANDLNELPPTSAPQSPYTTGSEEPARQPPPSSGPRHVPHVASNFGNTLPGIRDLMHPSHQGSYRPSNLSIKVPESEGSNVQEATRQTAPTAAVNGEAVGADEMKQGTNDSLMFSTFGGSQLSCFGYFDNSGEENLYAKWDENDKRNRGEVDALIVGELLCSDWIDQDNQPIPVPPITEIQALAQKSFRSGLQPPFSEKGFLANIATLVGTCLMNDERKTLVRRMPVGNGEYQYYVTWKVRYGSLRADFQLTETVPANVWGEDTEGCSNSDDPVLGQIPAEGEDAAQFWKDKYSELVHIMKTRIDKSMAVRAETLGYLRPLYNHYKGTNDYVKQALKLDPENPERFYKRDPDG